MCPFLLLLRWIGNNKNHAVKQQQTHLQIMVLSGMQIFGPYDSYWFGLFPLHFWKIIEHQTAIFILAHFGTFHEFQPCSRLRGLPRSAHVPKLPPVLCSFTGDTNLHLQPLQVDFFHTLVTVRNVTCQQNKTNGPLNGWNTEWLSWIKVNSISIQFVWSWAMLGHPVDWRIVGAGVSFCFASVLKHVSD